MVKAKLLKKVGRLSQGTIGVISDSDFENYGIGDGLVYPHSLPFYVDGQEATIANNLLELVNDEPKVKARRSARPQMAMNF